MCVQQCRSQLIVVLRCVQSNRIFSSMVEDLLMDIVLQSHQEIARNRAICDICHTRCVRSAFRLLEMVMFIIRARIHVGS